MTSILNWRACELHTHTYNSDGSQTLEELCRKAKAFGLEFLALTDHNTSSGIYENTPQLQRETLPVHVGIEWTTFFGHMVVLGAKKYVDWRDAVPSNIDEKMKAVRAAHGVIGVAHPFRLGAPMCCGCHWNFLVRDWSLPHYMEIWSGPFPTLREEAVLALEFWNKKLDEGNHLTPSYGRDWHSDPETPRPFACTMLGFKDDRITEEGAFDALRSGRTHVTLGPLVDLTVCANGNIYTCGESAPQGNVTVRVQCDLNYRRAHWEQFDLKAEKINLIGNGARILAALPAEGGEVTLDARSLTWLRAELYGSLEGKATNLAVTAPVYFASLRGTRRG